MISGTELVHTEGSHTLVHNTLWSLGHTSASNLCLHDRFNRVVFF